MPLSNNLRLGDFFNCLSDPPKLLTLEQVNEKYNLNLNFLTYHRIKSVIVKAAKSLNNKIFDQNLSDTKAPKLPLIHKLSSLGSKGCRIYYVALKSREWTELSTSNCENKWHGELGTHFSIDFWNQIWKINKHSLVSNKMRWVNLQIYRFILPTNYSVNKYKPLQDPGCSFCSEHLELLPYLFWSCPVVRDFWTMVGNILCYYYPQFKLGRKEAIFGDIKTKGNSIINTVLLLGKQFIWRQKFGSKSLDELSYIIFMKNELNFLLETMTFRGKKLEFYNDWKEILLHFEV